MEPDFGSWQTPDISRSHLYRGTIAWTPPTAIYRAYTVIGLDESKMGFLLNLNYRNDIKLIGEMNPWASIHLTHCVLVMPDGAKIWLNIGSGMAGLPEPTLT